ncbi:hypothetical protein GGI12_001549 [Dipsacomyces acuminosporus]|nr:hypothetical protein GGI12_001549 [Dipsacomyces acuminosporus]
MDKNYIHAKEFSNSRSYPVVGKLSCLHYMSESMARATLKARREAASVDSRVQVSWADVWYARWLFRWEVVTILGNENIKRYGEQPDKRAPTDMLARAVIADDDERARLFQVTPMDEAVVKWRDGAGAFVLRMLKPGVDMGKKYMESWENGRQQKLLEKFWDSTVKMDGLKLAAKMASSIVKGWNEVPDDTDDNRKKT